MKNEELRMKNEKEHTQPPLGEGKMKNEEWRLREMKIKG